MGINPPDWYLREGYKNLPPEWRPPVPFPVIPGTDVSGVVQAVAGDVDRFAVGDEVFGMVRFPGLKGEGAAYAEVVAAPASDLAHKPAGIDHAHAAAAPMAGLTAWQFLIELGHDHANPLQAERHRPVPLRGKRLLVNGAAGGVGHLVVQLAKWSGAPPTVRVVSLMRSDLSAVLVALEGTRRGRVSVEHVLNVLGRLNAGPAPASAATALQVLTPPLANTERYDRLRAVSTEEADHARRSHGGTRGVRHAQQGSAPGRGHRCAEWLDETHGRASIQEDTRTAAAAKQGHGLICHREAAVPAFQGHVHSGDMAPT